MDFIYFRANNRFAVGLFLIFVKIILMIVFGGIERWRGGYFRSYRMLERIQAVKFGFYFFGNLFLYRIMVKNSRTILCADIIALPVQCCRVMRREKYL